MTREKEDWEVGLCGMGKRETPRSSQTGQSGNVGLPVRGWLIHTPDKDYIDRVLAAAPRYGINHLDISHDFVHNIDEILERPGLAELVEQTARRCLELGIEAFVWSHEFNTRQPNLILNPAKPEGRAFWESRKQAYRDALKRCPSVAGVVLMFGSCPTEIWDPRITDPYWTRLSWPQRVRRVTQVVQSVVCGEMRRKLWVRDFNHGPAELRALIDGLRDLPGITVYSKAEPQDFQLFYPHSFSIGAYGRTPQVIEVDLNGEYWGQSLVPVSLVSYLRYRIGYGFRKGVKGAVGRIDTYDRRVLGTPSEINLYAFSRLLENPKTAEQEIYDGWLKQRYGLTPRSSAARRLQTILQRTVLMVKATYYTLGFWTPKNQSSMPSSMASISRAIVSKSTAQWNPAAKATEERLSNPDLPTVQAILAEKELGVTIAEQNLVELRGLRSALRPDDYQSLTKYFAGAVEVARLYQAVARAYWLTRLVELRCASKSEEEQAWAAYQQLLQWAERVEAGRVPLPGGPLQEAAKLRQLAADVERALRSAQTEPRSESLAEQ